MGPSWQQPAAAAVQRIDAAAYAAHAGALKHVYLAGDLQRPTPHPFIRDERVAVALCVYDAGDDGSFHWHRAVTEYELVIDGEVGYLDVGTGQTHWFQVGDFSMIAPGVCVKRLVRRPARTLAIKVPSAEEKVHCRSCPRACAYRVEAHVEAVT